MIACQNGTETSGPTSNSASFTAEGTISQWPISKFPLNLKVGRHFSGMEYNAIASAANSWSNSVDNKVQFFTIDDSEISELSSSGKYDDSELGIYKVFKWPKDMPSTALAVTQIFGNQKSNGVLTIDHADILVNFQNFTFSTDDSWGYDFESIVLHEMGHFLGLFHSNTSSEESVMYPSISKYTTNRYPKYKDTEEIIDLYNLNRQSSLSHKSLPQTNETGKKIRIIMELYPNGIEKVRIIKGVQNEIITKNCVHHEHLK